MTLNNKLITLKKNTELIIKNKNFFWAILFFFCIFSFITSINQGKYIYDGYHWGFVATNANDFLNGKLLYKEIFVHYGILTLIIHSIAYKIYSSIFSLIFITSLFYVASIFFATLVIKKISNINYCYLFLYILFFFQPFAAYPWHTYFIFFFVSLSLFLLLIKNIVIYFIFGFLLQLTYLSSESFEICSYIIFASTIILIYFENEKKISKYYKPIIFFTLGYLIPLIIFLFFLNKFELYSHWKSQNVPEIVLSMKEKSLFVFFKEFVIDYLTNIKDIYNKPIYLLGFILNLSCCIYIFLFLTKKLKKNYYIFLVSIFSLSLNFMLIPFFNSFRFFNGPILGIIVLSYLLFKTKYTELKNLLLLLLIFLVPLSNPFEKGESNSTYINKSIKDKSLISKNIPHFKNMRYPKEVWHHYQDVLNIINEIKINCSEINNFYNLTSDHFYFLLLSDYFNLNQKMPGYSEKWVNNKNSLKHYYDSYIKKIDKRFYFNLKESIKIKNTFFIRQNINNNFISVLDKKIFLDDYYFIDLNYSYYNKQKKLYIPKTCIIKNKT